MFINYHVQFRSGRSRMWHNCGIPAFHRNFHFSPEQFYPNDFLDSRRRSEVWILHELEATGLVLHRFDWCIHKTHYTIIILLEPPVSGYRNCDTCLLPLNIAKVHAYGCGKHWSKTMAPQIISGGMTETTPLLQDPTGVVPVPADPTHLENGTPEGLNTSVRGSQQPATAEAHGSLKYIVPSISIGVCVHKD